jgi:SNF2 family DNA or RNA helicase
LRAYQEKGRDLILGSPEKGFACFMDMGTGKTRTALAALVSLFGVGKLDLGQRTLVVCPRTVMPSWQEEAAKTTNLDVVILDGDKARRLRRLKYDEAPIAVINYEGLLSIAEELIAAFAAGTFGAVVFDESQRVSNRTAKQSKIAAKLSRAAKSVVLLSGTPVRSDSRDLWHQIFLIDGGKRLGDKFFPFQTNYFVNVSRNQIPNWKPRSGSEEIIKGKIADLVYRVEKKNVLRELPPKIFQQRVVNMTGDQVTAYVEMAREMVVELKGGELSTARTMLTRYLRLHQIAQGYLMDDQKTVTAEFEPNPKTHELLNILSEHPGKAIVWCYYRHTIESLEKLLAKKGYGPVTLYGETRDAEAVVRAFQTDKDVRVLIGQPQAGGLGVTLTAADLAVYYTNSWSHEHRSQSEDRCHRIGSEQHNVVNYIDLVAAGTIDATILAALKRKADTAEMLLTLNKELEAMVG